MNDNGIEVIGTVRCPEGEHARRREIAIGTENTARLPERRFLITRGKPGTSIKLMAGRDAYNTALRRFEKDSYITDGTRIMGFHLKEFLQHHGLDNRGTKLRLKVNEDEFRIL